MAKRAGVTHGRRFRVDLTVVETNVHFTTDNTWLQDRVRVLTRVAFVRSYRRLMATTRAVLRDADTMVCRLGQRPTDGRRRQQTVPDQQPSSRGSMFYGML